MEILFLHEAVLNAPMGCHHVCLYTSTAPASLIDERIQEHCRDVKHLPAFQNQPFATGLKTGGPTGLRV
jgi:hypothetical protein